MKRTLIWSLFAAIFILAAQMSCSSTEPYGAQSEIRAEILGVWSIVRKDVYKYFYDNKGAPEKSVDFPVPQEFYIIDQSELTIHKIDTDDDGELCYLMSTHEYSLTATNKIFNEKGSFSSSENLGDGATRSRSTSVIIEDERLIVRETVKTESEDQDYTEETLAFYERYDDDDIPPDDWKMDQCPYSEIDTSAGLGSDALDDDGESDDGESDDESN